MSSSGYFGPDGTQDSSLKTPILEKKWDFLEGSSARVTNGGVQVLGRSSPARAMLLLFYHSLAAGVYNSLGAGEGMFSRSLERVSDLLGCIEDDCSEPLHFERGSLSVLGRSAWGTLCSVQVAAALGEHAKLGEAKEVGLMGTKFGGVRAEDLKGTKMAEEGWVRVSKKKDD